MCLKTKKERLRHLKHNERKVEKGEHLNYPELKTQFYLGKPLPERKIGTWYQKEEGLTESQPP